MPAQPQLQAYLDAVLRLQPKKHTLQISESVLRSMLAEFRECVKNKQLEQAVAWMHVVFAHMASSDDRVPEDCVTIAVHCATYGLYLACMVNDQPFELSSTSEQSVTLLDRKDGFVQAWDKLRGFAQAASRALKRAPARALSKQPSTLCTSAQHEQ